MELKYIITNKNDFAIFTKLSTHFNVGKRLHGTPVGAGFCNFAVGYKEDTKRCYFCKDKQRQLLKKEGNIVCPSCKRELECQEKTTVNIHCYGKSISLGLESREEDEEIINKALNN